MSGGEQGYGNLDRAEPNADLGHSAAKAVVVTLAVVGTLVGGGHPGIGQREPEGWDIVQPGRRAGARRDG